MKLITPEHYEVSIAFDDSTSRGYRVLASSAEAAEAHVQSLHPEGRILSRKTLHRQEWHQEFVEAIEVVGTAEAAEILGISAEALKKRRERGTLPEPVADLACGTIWLRRDIERMAA